MKRYISIFTLIGFFAACTSVMIKSPVSPIPSKMAWNHADWDAALYAEDLAHFSDLDKGSADMVRFCPKYLSLDQNGRIGALMTMQVAIANSESSWDPASTSVDVGSQDDQDTWSTGLFQVSVTDQDAYNLSFGQTATQNPITFNFADLKTAVPNIRLAVAIMAKLIAKSGIIAVGCNNANSKGLASYWSTMRSDECGVPAYHALGSIIPASQKAPGCL